MVVTVEPGIYFSAYALQHFYLPLPVHSKYINSEVVKRYLPVGGVRIEDALLITSNGYENLTMAPKGDAMLKIIRDGKSSVPSSSIRRILQSKTIEEEIRLLRAPGISRDVPTPILKPLSRATTMPTELDQKESIDFELFNGPSLFSNFKHSMTTSEKIRRWQQSHEPMPGSQNSAVATEKPVPVCGEATPNVQHVYMSSASNLVAASRVKIENEGQQRCNNCSILVQTLDRLRRNLITSTQPSQKQE